MPIGNDLVDLRAPEIAGKAEDERFTRRVLSDSEARCLLETAEPDLALWMIWAAKEAAFKAARKVVGEIPFAHRSFQVALAADVASRVGAERGGAVSGTVDVLAWKGGEGLSCRVDWQVSDSFVHCIARAGPDHHAWRTWSSVLDCAEAGPAPDAEYWEPRERISIHSPASAVVRRLAKNLAVEAGLGPVDIVREPRGRSYGPPTLFRPGASEPIPSWDLSLSHHGGLVAVALTGPPATPSNKR
ncbi:MAG: 4'-phosphopantetheinyl transferase superfamily protein [Gemmatimonadota bacterium]